MLLHFAANGARTLPLDASCSVGKTSKARRASSCEWRGIDFQPPHAFAGPQILCTSKSCSFDVSIACHKCLDLGSNDDARASTHHGEYIEAYTSGRMDRVRELETSEKMNGDRPVTATALVCDLELSYLPRLQHQLASCQSCPQRRRDVAAESSLSSMAKHLRNPGFAESKKAGERRAGKSRAGGGLGQDPGGCKGRRCPDPRSALLRFSGGSFAGFLFCVLVRVHGIC